MAKVKVHTGAETPSQQVVADANRSVVVTDAKGRKLTLRQPKFLDEFRIVEAVGAELAQNQTYMAMLNPLLFVGEIDGEVQPFPTTKIAVDSLISTVGRDGFIAVAAGIAEHFVPKPDGEKEQIKN